MRDLVVLVVVLSVASAGCIGGGVFDDAASENGTSTPPSDEPDSAEDGEIEGSDERSSDGESPPAPGDLPDEVDARFVVDGEPLDNLTVEVADTPETRRRGLMFRENLSGDHGMLFVFGSERSRTFWMKNTIVPLDIVFLDREMRVVDVEHAAPDPGDVADDELPRYRSDAPARYVVEVNRGYANETGLSEGDRVELLR